MSKNIIQGLGSPITTVSDNDYYKISDGSDKLIKRNNIKLDIDVNSRYESGNTDEVFSITIGNSTTVFKMPPEQTTFTVTFIYYVGETRKSVSQSVERGNDAIVPSDFSETGFTGHVFSGWDQSYTDIQSNKIISAIYDNSKLLVEFYYIKKYTDGDTIREIDELIDQISIDYGSSISQSSGYYPDFPSDDDYSSWRWEVSGLTNITENKRIQCIGTLKTVTVGTQSNPSAGGITSGSGSYIKYSDVVLTATASSGYSFDTWETSTVGPDYLYKEELSNNPLNIFATDATYVAKFKINEYEIVATSNPESYGVVTGSGTYQHGSSVSLVATANSGYEFAHWTKNGAIISSDSSLTFNATKDETYVAEFREIV